MLNFTKNISFSIGKEATIFSIIGDSTSARVTIGLLGEAIYLDFFVVYLWLTLDLVNVITSLL